MHKLLARTVAAMLPTFLFLSIPAWVSAGDLAHKGAEATTPASITPEMAVFTRKGISPARASQALRLQSRVAETQLVDKVETALAGAYAGVWFEPAAAKLHVGVTSNASRQTVASVVAKAGLGAEVTETPVRSTRPALLAEQRGWDARLARLLAPGEVMTAIDPQRDAVVVKLSSSVPSPQRTALEGVAASAHVNVFIRVVPPSAVRIEPKGTTCEFASTWAEATHYAWCEKTITSGVAIESKKERCTAGPMLIKGTKTFVLTAGHCVVEGVGEEWKSEWPNPMPPRNKEGTKTLGKVTAETESNEFDIAEIEVERTSEFVSPLPTPVPALIADWGNWVGYTGNPPKGKPLEPKAIAPGLQFESRAVSGESPPVTKFADCHEGKTSGEQCGEVLMENVVKPNPRANEVETENLVEDSACAEKGDSGGPFFHYGESNKIFIEGTMVGGKTGACNATGTGGTATPNFFEPMKTILKLYKGQRLLTTANQLRKPRLKRPGGGAPLTKKAYTSSIGASTIETVAGSKLTCTGGSGKGEASAESSGTVKLTLTGCEAFGNKCHTSGAVDGEVVLSANYKLAFTDGTADEVGLLLELTEAAIECGTKCPTMTIEKLKLRGTGIGVATPIDEEVAPSKKFTIAFSQSKGIQAPTEYENEEGTKIKATLEMEGSGSKTFSFEKAGMSETDELLFEETAEIEP
jgi:hypothetical protein